MDYDPTIYLGAARHYANGRPPYSAVLADTLAAELHLDGRGVLVDVGCGPGILALELAHLFEAVVGIDPDAGMVTEAATRADELGIANVTWLQARAEDIPTLGLPAPRLVTFGQSFHWTDREVVADAVHHLLEPGGAIALIAPTVEGRPVPEPPGPPVIPHREVEALVRAYLGPKRRAGKGFPKLWSDRFAEVLARTRFGTSRTVFAPGRPDLVRDTNSVVDGFFSMSWAAPHLFGDRRDAFETELRALLRAYSPEGLFWDWPGDTEIVIATRPG